MKNFFCSAKRTYFYVATLLCALGLASMSLNAFCHNFYEKEDMTSNSILLLNCNTGATVFHKNENQKRSMASLTKIMTYMIVVDNTQNLQDTKVTIKPEVLSMVDPDSSTAGLRPFDELSIFDLLHCLMICSGNDAAYVLADYVAGGDILKFVEMMNEKAAQLGCVDTHFVTPDGMYSEEHYSTAKDIYLITKTALEYPFFREICGKREYKVFDDDRESIKTTNKMMNPNEPEYYCPYVKGIKTGWDSKSGRCLVSLAEKGGVSYICVVLGGSDKDPLNSNIQKNMAMIESKKLYSWAFANLELKTLLKREYPFGEVKLKYAFGKDRLVLNLKDNAVALLPKSVSLKDLDIEFSLPDEVKAPVTKGDIIGTAKFSYKQEPLLEIKLSSCENVPFNIFVFVFESLKNIVCSKIFIAVLLLIILYGSATVVFNKKIKTRNRKQKARQRYRGRN